MGEFNVGHCRKKVNGNETAATRLSSVWAWIPVLAGRGGCPQRVVSGGGGHSGRRAPRVTGCGMSVPLGASATRQVDSNDQDGIIGEGDGKLESKSWEGSCPECGGSAVFREVRAGQVPGACCLGERCWWSTVRESPTGACLGVRRSKAMNRSSLGSSIPASTTTRIRLQSGSKHSAHRRPGPSRRRYSRSSRWDGAVPSRASYWR